MRKLLLVLVVLSSNPLLAQIPATLGWYQVPNTSLAPVFTPNNFGGSGYSFFDNRQYLVDSWSSGIFDTKRNQYMNWGGGHIGYAGNEFYTFNVDTLAVARLNDPSLPIGLATSATCGPNNGNTISPGVFACSLAIGPGTGSLPNNGTSPAPNSVHTYDGEVYMPNVDRFFIYSGDIWCSGGCTSPGTWTFSLATNTWQRMNPANDICSNTNFTCPNGFEGTSVAYDSNSGKVYVSTLMDRWAFTYDAVNGGSYQHLGPTQCCINTQNVSIVDPKRKKWVSIGAGEQWVVDISSGSSYTRNALGSTGGAAFINHSRPGLAYDPVQDRIVAWAGGNDIGLLNMDTLTWTTVTYAGGPAEGAAGTGTFKRFQYSPKNNLFMVRTGTSLNMFTVRLTAEDQSQFNFTDRCYGPGVVVCNPFDGAANIPHNQDPGLYASSEGNFGTIDPAVKASGAGSLHFTVPANSSPNATGQYRATFGQNFGQNSTFYVQYRFRISPEMLTNTFNSSGGSTSWKQVIFHSLAGGSCADVELTTVKFDQGQNRPMMYTRCGSNTPTIPANVFKYIPGWQNQCDGGVGPNCTEIDYQQGDVGYGSANPCNKTGAGFNTSGCFNYLSNNWMTFYYKISIGTWGAANSTIEAWVAPENQPFIKFVNMPNFTLTDGGVTSGYNMLTMTNFMTSKDFNDTNPVANSWYDELIVSTQPIAAPSGQSMTSIPTAPANLTVGILP